MTASALAESSLLLWGLSALVVMMGAVVALGWLRQAQLKPRLRDNWRAALIAAVALGTGICGAIVLGLSAEALPFPLGYRVRDVPLLWLGTVAACFVAMALLGQSMRWYSVLASGLVLGGVTVAAQLGWINAIGFRPGVVWRESFIVIGAVLMVVGMTAGLWLAFLDPTRQGGRRTLWRVGSALLMGMAVIGGQEIVLAGTNLPAQVASVFRRDVPAPLLCLVLGVLVPLVYVLMAFDLRMLRQQQRRARRQNWQSRFMEGGPGEAGSGLRPGLSPSPPRPPGATARPTLPASEP